MLVCRHKQKHAVLSLLSCQKRTCVDEMPTTHALESAQVVVSKGKHHNNSGGLRFSVLEDDGTTAVGAPL